MLDGFALALAEGTGLTTYSKAVGQLLADEGQVLDILYGPDTAASRVGNRAAMMARWLDLRVRGACRPTRMKSGERPATGFSASAWHIPQLYSVAFRHAAATRQAVPIRLPADCCPEIFHCTSPLPIRVEGIPQVVTLHDLIPLTHPDLVGRPSVLYRRYLAAAFQSADLILAVSEYAMDCCRDAFGIEPERFAVTYQSVTQPPEVAALSEAALEAALVRDFGLKPREYFLFYGAMEPKKNLERVIQAALNKADDRPLVMVTDHGWLNGEVQQRLDSARDDAKGRQRLHRYPFLSRTTLMTLVRGARAVVFPSLTEGFGLPVLEAMQSATPVITSDRGALPEVGGDAVLTVDPLSVSSIAAAMDRIAGSDALVETLSHAGRVQASRFSVDNHRQRLMDAYARVRV